MIDPKFDKLPEKPVAGANDRSQSVLDEKETPQRAGAPRQGLSINDTVAADANLSTGGRGADVSGVRAGSGAGAGSSYVTPGRSNESPAPNIARGPKGSGTTPVSDSAIEQSNSEQGGPGLSGSADSHLLSDHEIAQRAYHCWHERGCPEGSPEVDWQRAETELREFRMRSRAASATA